MAEDPDVKISNYLDAHADSTPAFVADDADRERRLRLLYDLPLQFAEEEDLHALFGLILKRMVELIPSAERGALLVIDPVYGKLALRASIPEDDPPISRTLIQRAVGEERGFIWSRQEEVDVSQSIRNLGMQSGMYAPLLWKGEVQGVVCVDSQHHSAVFTEDDLRFMLCVAHYAAAAVANHFLQLDLTQNNTVLQRLLTNFSPALRGKLLEKARHDALQPGGEKSNVTLLMSDIRGFTRLTEGMDSAVVVEMLNEYFSALVEAVFEHNGTVDKFIGDAILAVFGSPEADEDQQKHAVDAALAMHEAMNRVNDARKRRGAVTCEIGIGLHYGEVLHGFIGAEERLEFTVIGETVNRTARYCDGAGPGETLISPQLHSHVADEYETRPKTIPTKHEGDFDGQLVIGARKGA